MRWLIVISTLSTLHLACTAVDAQLVRIGPSYVQAPFVRVHKYPDGSSYVRAPFVSVNSPGRRSYRHSHRIPSHAFHQMSWDSLCWTICEATETLEAQLRTFPTGAHWCNHLVTEELRDLLDRGSRGPLIHEERRRAGEILQVYNAVRDTPELAAVVNLSGFKTVHLALHELLLTPEQRLRRELGYSAEVLDESLSRLKDGPRWRDFLALGLENRGDQAPTYEHVARVLRRYESLHQDDVIAQLPAFRETRDLLAQYLHQLEEPPAAVSPTIEQLPPPPPAPYLE